MLYQRVLQVVTAIAVTAALPPHAHAQDSFDRAKALYLEAAYEDALALLETPGPAGGADVHLYRALCLLALGRASEAEAAIARSVEADPTASAARPDVSPRVATMLTDARRRLLPDIARRRVAEGRSAYQQGDKLGATQRFETAVRLLDDPSLAGQSELADLKTLANGFLDLLRAQASPPAVSPGSTAPATPAPTTQTSTPAAAQAASTPLAAQPSAAQPPAATPASGAPSAAAPAGTAAPRPEPPAPAAAAAPPAETTGAAAAGPVSRPVPISQAMPPWRAPDPSWRNRELRGALVVTIDATGRVTAAQIEQSINPVYDRLLLEAARGWRYTPATQNGQPIATQLRVPIVIRP